MNTNKFSRSSSTSQSIPKYKIQQSVLKALSRVSGLSSRSRTRSKPKIYLIIEQEKVEMVLVKTEDAFKFPHEMLLATGLWPLENKTWRYKLKTAASWVGILGLFLAMWVEFFNDLHDLVKLSGIVYILVSFINAITKQVGFTTNHKTLQEIVVHLKDSVFIAHSEDLDQYMVQIAKFSARFAQVYRVLGATYIILLGIFPIIDRKALPYPFPYDVGNYYFLMYIFQMSSACVVCWNHIALDLIVVSLIGVAAAQLDILNETIMRIKAESEFYEDYEKRNEVALKQLKHCVNHHLAIIKLIEYIEKIFSVGILAQYLCTSLVICNTVFNFLWVPLSFQFGMLVDYLVAVLFQLYIYCWFGNEILTKTVQVGEACYSFNWYDYGVPVRKYVFIIMERSKRPSGITALKFTTLSIQSLTTILRGAYSMLTILLNIYKKTSTPGTE